MSKSSAIFSSLLLKEFFFAVIIISVILVAASDVVVIVMHDYIDSSKAFASSPSTSTDSSHNNNNKNGKNIATALQERVLLLWQEWKEWRQRHPQFITAREAIQIVFPSANTSGFPYFTEFGFLDYNESSSGGDDIAAATNVNNDDNNNLQFTFYPADPDTMLLNTASYYYSFYLNKEQHARYPHLASEAKDRFIWNVQLVCIPACDNYIVDAQTGEIVGHHNPTVTRLYLQPSPLLGQ